MLVTNLNKAEFEKRRNDCQKVANERGLNGVMVWSRGGGTWDRYAGCGYFANHYQQRCYLPDELPLWSGRSHCVLFIPKTGKAVLCVTTLEYRADLVAIEDIRYSTNFFQLVEDTAKELGMDSGNVGLMYADTLTWKIGSEVIKRLPDMNWITCDDILEEMRMVKTPMEQDAIRKACEIGTEAVNIIMANVKEGKTEAEIIAPGMEHVYANGACLYFIVTNSGENSTPVHSIDFPGYDYTRPVKNGDLFKVDFIIVYQGYICDFGRTTVVGGVANEVEKMMIKTIADACEHVMKHVKPGLSVKELCRIGDEYLINAGITLSAEQNDPDKIYAAFPPHWGHGIGMTWERPWFIETEETILEEGMYIAVEKALYKQDVGTVTYEQNMLITKDGVEVLTKTSPYCITNI